MTMKSTKKLTVPKELYLKTGITFTVNATNLSDYNLEYFNNRLTPDVKVMDAIVASSSLPILFPPYLINETYYYDGGFCDNCPVELVDELFTIAFELTCKTSSFTNFKVVDLIFCLAKISNQKDKCYNNIYKVNITKNVKLLVI
jgi:predicted acylesterase/phospholipase RssA